MAGRWLARDRWAVINLPVGRLPRVAPKPPFSRVPRQYTLPDIAASLAAAPPAPSPTPTPRAMGAVQSAPEQWRFPHPHPDGNPFANDGSASAFSSAGAPRFRHPLLPPVADRARAAPDSCEKASMAAQARCAAHLARRLRAAGRDANDLASRTVRRHGGKSARGGMPGAVRSWAPAASSSRKARSARRRRASASTQTPRTSSSDLPDKTEPQRVRSTSRPPVASAPDTSAKVFVTSPATPPKCGASLRSARGGSHGGAQ